MPLRVQRDQAGFIAQRGNRVQASRDWPFPSAYLLSTSGRVQPGLSLPVQAVPATRAEEGATSAGVEACGSVLLNARDADRVVTQFNILIA